MTEVRLIRASDDDKPVIARLIQLYLYDMATQTPFAIAANGLYDYGNLDAFAIRAGGTSPPKPGTTPPTPSGHGYSRRRVGKTFQPGSMTPTGPCARSIVAARRTDPLENRAHPASESPTPPDQP